MRLSQLPTKLLAISAPLVLGSVLMGCSGGGGEFTLTNSTGLAGASVGFFATAPVDGGSCSVFDSKGLQVGGTVVTAKGNAAFSFPPSTGDWLKVVCSGGTYTDPASGTTLQAPEMRAYAQTVAGVNTVVASPVTELSARLLGNGTASAAYNTLNRAVETSLGLTNVSTNTLAPIQTDKTALPNTAAGQYTTLLLALSQLQLAGTYGKTTASLLAGLTAALNTTGEFTDAKVPQALATALDNLADNPRLNVLVSGTGEDVTRTVFENLTHADTSPSILAIDADQSLTQSETGPARIAQGTPSVIAVYGYNLSLGLKVSLGNKSCKTRDLGPMENGEKNSDIDQLFAECPAQTAGTATLAVLDGTQSIFTEDIQVVSASEFLAATQRDRARNVAAKGTGPGTVRGNVTAVAPTINTETGALIYTALRTFQVKGVVVELLDKSTGDAVLLATSTDEQGAYVFEGVDTAKSVAVRVKAQLKKDRTTGASTGAQWDFSVRDNTSTSSPKTLYTLDSPTLQTSGAVQTVDIKASLGFDETGSLKPSEPRQSAAFSILEVVYSAASKIQATDANVVLPAVNIYWSPSNVGVDGDKNKGQISTSHFSSSGAMPGVFILGKADVDTDEFDQGVIGHEFGHYLQSVLSADDSPGGNHATHEFKDASLAYGEGYGTAVGGLLMGSPFYIDTSGPKQAAGGVTNMNLPSPAGKRKGFYSEESVAYVMYQIGVRHGFTAFWSAVSALKTSGHHSATLFSFLDAFIKAQPSANIQDFLTAENIRSTDPMGLLPGGTTPDAAIAAAANGGAGDLERLYIEVNLKSVEAGATATDVVASGDSFCVNRNLKGAALSNGLGMSRRFTFTAPFSGELGIKPVDDKKVLFDGQNTNVTARDSTGAKVSVFGADEMAGKITVVQGRQYTVKVQAMDPSAIFNGNRCNNQLQLFRLPA